MELKIVLDEAAFSACTVDTDDAGSRGGEEERGQVVDEAHADVVAKGDGIFETILVFCNGDFIVSRRSLHSAEGRLPILDNFK